MLLGDLVKFKIPTVAKFCDSNGTHDFIIENPACGIIVGIEVDYFTGEDSLEVYTAGEILFSIFADDIDVIEVRKNECKV